MMTIINTSVRDEGELPYSLYAKGWVPEAEKRPRRTAEGILQYFYPNSLGRACGIT